MHSIHIWLYWTYQNKRGKHMYSLCVFISRCGFSHINYSFSSQNVIKQNKTVSHLFQPWMYDFKRYIWHLDFRNMLGIIFSLTSIFSLKVIMSFWYVFSKCMQYYPVYKYIFLTPGHMCLPSKQSIMNICGWWDLWAIWLFKHFFKALIWA